MAKKFTYFDSTDGVEKDAEAFETGDHINASTGVSDAGKPILTDAAGLIDGSFIDDSDIDHGSIGGLTDDDHTQYTLADGTRAFSGDQSMGANQLTSVGDPTSATIDAAADDAVPMSFLASTTASEGSSTIGVQDSAGNFAGDDVEAVLAELADLAAGPTYTTDGVGVTKGDLVHLSGNNIVTLTAIGTDPASNRSVGLATTTAGAASSVRSAANDTIITGILTAASPGDTYYWSGTAHVSTPPATAGNFVWQTGIAVNATDLALEVRFKKKQS